MEKKTIILPELRYHKAPAIDLTTKVGLETSEELLREGDRSIILDLEEQFSYERAESKKYKIYGKVRMIFRNMYSGLTPYNNLAEYLYLNGDGASGDNAGYLPYDEFAFIRRDTYREDTSIPMVSGSTYGTYSPTFSQPTKPRNKHQIITNLNAPYHNWNFYLSYVYSSDTEFQMSYTLSGATSNFCNNTTQICFKAKDGIPCRVEEKPTYYKLTTPVPHNIAQNEFVIFSSISAISDRTYTVSELGDDKYDSEKYVIKLNKQQFSGVTIPQLVTIKRCTNDKNISGTTSNYYVHKHKILTAPTDYILDKAGFESPIFEHERKILFEDSAGNNDVIVERNRPESLIYDFKNSFILTGLTNNLGYTPTEVYVTVLFKNGSGYFEYPPKVGYRFHLHDGWMDNHFSGNAALETSISGSTFTNSGITFTSGRTVPVGTVLTGAFVEYNPSELKERIISESLHKIVQPTTIFDHDQDQNVNGFSGATANNKMGLLYQPHYRVKLRQLSPYIETFNTNNILDLPDNARYFPDEKLWKWRDLYDHGFIDDDGNGTDYPFVNGQHYVKTDFNFYFINEKEFNNKNNGFKGFKKDINC
jgi:hypothetical protein